MRVIAILLGLGLLPLAAQTVIRSGPNRIATPQSGPETLVRAQNGDLYLVYCDQVSTGPSQFDIFVARSTDGGRNWNMKWQSGFASLGSTDDGNHDPGLAIDSQGNLHVAWYHQTSAAANDRTIRYRRWNAGTSSWDPQLTLNASTNTQNLHSVLAVDSKDYVWLLYSNATSLWRCDLTKSTQPFNAANAFSSPVAALPSGGNRHPDMVVDAMDYVHVTYADPTRVTICHIWIDPAATNPQWSSPVVLANQNGVGDSITTLAADGQGNVYVVYSQDIPGGKTQDPRWFLRRWDGQTQTLSSAINFYGTTRSQWEPATGVNNPRIISAAVDEGTGELYFIYRDVDQGELILARWRNGDLQPTAYAKLMNTGALAPNLTSYFVFPQIRGSLFPVSNRTAWGLDMTYTAGDQTASTPVYTLYGDFFAIGSLSSAAVAKVGTTYALGVLAPQQSAKPYVAALTLSGVSPGLPVGRRTIAAVPDGFFFVVIANVLPSVFVNFAGVLDGAGTAGIKVVIPNVPQLAGVKVDGVFITVDPGGESGLGALSNPWGFTITR